MKCQAELCFSAFSISELVFLLVFSFSFRKITESVSKLSARLGCGFSSNFDFVNTNSIFFYS